MRQYNPRRFTLLGVMAIAILAGACGPAGRMPCPEPGEELATPGPGEERVAFTLKNDTCMSICVLLLSPDHCDSMGGVNWLEGQPLRSMDSVTVEIPPGQYTAWVEQCTEEYRADEGLRVYSDYTHSVIDPVAGSRPPCGISLTIVNKSDVPICEVRIGVTESVYTGWDWLGDQDIQPGESLALTVRPDTYFLRAMACNGDWLRSDVDVSLSGDQTWTVP